MAQKHTGTTKPTPVSRRPSPPLDAVLPVPEDINEQLDEIHDDKVLIGIFLKWLQEWHEANPGVIENSRIEEVRKELDAVAHLHADNRDSFGRLTVTRQVISQLPFKDSERMVPMLHMVNITTDPEMLKKRALAEKARNLDSTSAMESRMSLSDDHKTAAKDRYVPPSRVGKKAMAGFFTEELITELKTLAVVQKRTVQSVLDEALADVVKKHSRDMALVRQLLQDRTP